MPDDLTNTDKKILFSDHDLLVRVNTVLDIMVKQQGEFIGKYERGHEEVVQRITALEVKQASHLEATKSNTDDIAALQKRSNWFDIINAGATATVAALMVFWKGK